MSEHTNLLVNNFPILYAALVQKGEVITFFTQRTTGGWSGYPYSSRSGGLKGGGWRPPSSCSGGSKGGGGDPLLHAAGVQKGGVWRRPPP